MLDPQKDVLAIATGPAPIISREAVLEEAKRHSILGTHYDREADVERLSQSLDERPEAT